VTALPLTPGQEQMYAYMRLLNPTDPGATYLNQSVRMVWDGAFDDGAFARAVSELAARHGALRVRLAGDADRPTQVVLAPEPVRIHHVDLTGHADVDAAVSRLAAEDEYAPFDLRTPPLFRVTVLRLSPRRHVVLSTFHHLVFDGWSHGLYARELERRYRLQLAGVGSDDGPGYAYADWVRASRDGAEAPERLAYWAARIPVPPPPLVLSGVALRPDTPPEFRYALHWRPLEPALRHTLMRCAVRFRASLFVVAAAAHALVLHRHSGASDLVVGTLVSGRDTPPAAAAIGCAPNVTFLRINVHSGQTFGSLVESVRAEWLAASAHQCSFFAYTESVLAQRVSPYEVFQAWFQFHVPPSGADDRPTGLPYRIEPFRYPLPETIGWTCHVGDDPARRRAFARELPAFEVSGDLSWLAVQYNAGRYDERAVAGLADEYVEVLRDVARDPATRATSEGLAARFR
jgi:hypothetical protein